MENAPLQFIQLCIATIKCRRLANQNHATNIDQWKAGVISYTLFSAISNTLCNISGKTV